MAARALSASLRTESLDDDAPVASTPAPRARARAAVFERFDDRARAMPLDTPRARRCGLALALEALGVVPDDAIATFATLDATTRRMMQRATRRGRTPRLAPRGYAARGALFNEPFRATVDERGAHRVVWGARGDGRATVWSKEGAKTVDEAMACVHEEIARRAREGVPSIDDATSKVRATRVCENCRCDCSKTPLMRRGPDGIGTLCNACGLWYSRHRTMRECLPKASTPRAPTFIRSPAKSRKDLEGVDVFGYASPRVQAALAKACAAVLKEEEDTLPRGEGGSKLRNDEFKRAIDHVYDRYDHLFIMDPQFDREDSRARWTHPSPAYKVDGDGEDGEDASARDASVESVENLDMFTFDLGIESLWDAV